MDNGLLFDARARVLADLQARRLADAAAVSVLEDAVAQRTWWAEQWPEGEQSSPGSSPGRADEDRRPLARLPGLRRPRPQHALYIQPTSAVPTRSGCARRPVT